MSDTETQDSPLRAAHTKAAAIVDELLLEGAPIVSFSTFGDGSKVEFVFYKPDGQWAFRVPVENLKTDSVRRMLAAYL
jgi:hypothetical protein